MSKTIEKLKLFLLLDIFLNIKPLADGRRFSTQAKVLLGKINELNIKENGSLFTVFIL